MIPVPEALGYAALGWFVFVAVVEITGCYKVFRCYSSRPKKPVSPRLPRDQVPHVTVIRPAKGLEPFLYECLASTFQQDYPKDKLTVYFCVASKNDSAYPVMCQLLRDFPDHDARIYIESEDPVLHGDSSYADSIGPNPKIRNMSRAYREAKGDIIWVVDCNGWIAKNICGRMVDALEGYKPDGTRMAPCKFVHLLPLVVDTVSSIDPVTPETQSLLAGHQEVNPEGHDVSMSALAQGGGRIEEAYIATVHDKFYCAFSALGVACIVGKSNMFRKSHLDFATDSTRNPNLPASAIHMPRGLDYFSHIICEDQWVAVQLMQAKIPGFKQLRLGWGDLVIQPVAGMSVSAYMARRVRWIRVRKWTAILPTLIEPGIETLLGSFYFSYALTTVPYFHDRFGVPQTWKALGICWGCAILIRTMIDRQIYKRLHAGYSLDIDETTPSWARGHSGSEKRPFLSWLPAYIARECLAPVLWMRAVFFGNTVRWRGRRFRILPNTSVVPLDPDDYETARDTKIHNQNKSD